MAQLQENLRYMEAALREAGEAQAGSGSAPPAGDCVSDEAVARRAHELETKERELEELDASVKLRAEDMDRRAAELDQRETYLRVKEQAQQQQQPGSASTQVCWWHCADPLPSALLLMCCRGFILQSPTML